MFMFTQCLFLEEDLIVKTQAMIFERVGFGSLSLLRRDASEHSRVVGNCDYF